MKILKKDRALSRRRFLRFNILAALIILIVALYLMIKGDYATIEESKSDDAIYNTLRVRSSLYKTFIWISCVMTKPFWFPKKHD